MARPATTPCTPAPAPTTTGSRRAGRSRAHARGPTSRGMGWFLLAGALVAIGIVGGLGVRSRSSRQRALVQLCANAGLSYAVLDPFPDTTLLPFRVFGWGSAHGVENVVWDAGDDRAIRVFDLWVQRRTDEARRAMTCGVVPLPFSVPTIALLSRGQVDPSGEPVSGD